jgi:apolipoprotein N-acyltransferase
VENRVAAVNADTAWDSAIIDRQGRVIAAEVDIAPRSVVLIETVHLGTGTSPFVTTGNRIGWICLALAVLWTGISTRSLRRRSIHIR